MEEALENGATQVNNVVHSMRLQSTQFDKKVCISCSAAPFAREPQLSH